MHLSNTREHPPNIDTGFALYDRYASAILAFLGRHTTSPEDAEDLLVEVFLAALDKPDLTSLSPEHQQAWLYRVASNKLVDHLRRVSRQPRFSSLDKALEQESGD